MGEGNGLCTLRREHYQQRIWAEARDVLHSLRLTSAASGRSAPPSFQTFGSGTTRRRRSSPKVRTSSAPPPFLLLSLRSRLPKPTCRPTHYVEHRQSDRARSAYAAHQAVHQTAGSSSLTPPWPRRTSRFSEGGKEPPGRLPGNAGRAGWPPACHGGWPVCATGARARACGVWHCSRRLRVPFARAVTVPPANRGSGVKSPFRCGSTPLSTAITPVRATARLHIQC
eukprot:SAG11_NODE_95_length_17051_cov_3.557102_4_plen_226_part_00